MQKGARDHRYRTAMKFLLAVICILSISWNVGLCIKCMKCENDEGESCSGPIETCDSSVDSCVSLLLLSLTAISSTCQVRKSCLDDAKLSSATFNATFGPMKIYSVAQCCKGDGCNKEDIKLPDEDQKENGLICPSCTAIGGKKCVSDKTVKCTGAQTKCFSYSGGVYFLEYPIKVQVKGCITEDACTTSVPTYPVTPLKEDYNMTCP